MKLAAALDGASPEVQSLLLEVLGERGDSAALPAVTKLVDYEAAKEAVKASVPSGTEDLNLKAFERGYQHGLSLK